MSRPIDILLVEDNPGDVGLAREGFEHNLLRNNLHVVSDGEEAMIFLKREGKYVKMPRPDIILLDLNLPLKDGREVLAEIKNDDELLSIPVIVLTTSESDEDIKKSYHLHANCYVTKPINFTEFVTVVKSIADFWFTIVKLSSA